MATLFWDKKGVGSWWKVSKHGWAHRLQTFVTQAYKNIFGDTSASVPSEIMLRSSLSMYIFFVYNISPYCMFC
jgi:hypothetical protein